MTGCAAALVFALALNQTPVHAQDDVFTVSVSSADVHKGPSIATPVIGHVPQGTAMTVVRNLGSWIKVEWPAAPDGFAYLHVTTGQLGAPAGSAPKSAAAVRPASTAVVPASSRAASRVPASPPLSTAASQAGQPAKAPKARRERVVIRQQGSTPITHLMGVGGLFGSTSSIGATGRAWRDNGFGVQVGFAHESMTSGTAAGHVASVQVEPAIVYGLFDRVGDYFWVRPYVGSGLSIRHEAFHDATPAGASAPSSTGVGFRAFGGAEVTFAGAPRFALSVDLGYRRLPTPFPGFEAAHVNALVSGHWYVK